LTKSKKVIIPSLGTLYYLNEQLHREDGPAIVYCDGTEEWYLNDYRHRIDGPAIVYPNGILQWYLNGEKVNPEDLPCDYEYLKLKYLL